MVSIREIQHGLSPREGVAQSVEQRTFNPLVLGSSPSTLTQSLGASLVADMRETSIFRFREGRKESIATPSTSQLLLDCGFQ